MLVRLFQRNRILSYDPWATRSDNKILGPGRKRFESQEARDKEALKQNIEGLQ